MPSRIELSAARACFRRASVQMGVELGKRFGSGSWILRVEQSALAGIFGSISGNCPFLKGQEIPANLVNGRVDHFVAARTCFQRSGSFPTRLILSPTACANHDGIDDGRQEGLERVCQQSN